MDGRTIAIIGLAINMLLAGIGSAYGLYKTGSAASGVLSEDSKKFSKVIVLALLPATQGIYGFVLSVMKISMLPAVGAAASAGWAVGGALAFLGLTTLASAVLQGKTASSCIYAVGKNSEGSGKYVLFPAMIEFYAILALVLGIMI
ncbi:MAG: permease [Clostridia bacterium]|jgi:V/A-type H+-transporting ATPase subunit K|nr:permease [Clostridia bacterium]MBQ1942700.1 permease [Clostridia bacterium]